MSSPQQNLKAMPTPLYDVTDHSPDKITGERPAFVLVDELRWRIDRPDCPRSGWLPAEKVVMDYSNFETDMRNDFDCLIGYGRGPENFTRGLLALRAISATEQVLIVEQAKCVLEASGLNFPEPLSESWWDSEEGYDDLTDEAVTKLRDLSRQYASGHLSSYLKVLEYVQSQRDELACRLPASSDAA